PPRHHELRGSAWHRRCPSPPASSRGPPATLSATAWTRRAPAGPPTVPRPSSVYAPSKPPTTSTPTGRSTSPRSTASIMHRGTPTGRHHYPSPRPPPDPSCDSSSHENRVVEREPHPA